MRAEIYMLPDYGRPSQQARSIQHQIVMNITIRDTTPDDVPAIVDIYNEQILHGTATFHTQPQTVADRAKWLAELRAENYPCVVAVSSAADGARVVGFCGLWHYNMRPAYDG